MLTDCAPTRPVKTTEPERTDVSIDHLIELDQLDPLSKQCPDDVPCRVQDSDLWFADTPAALEQAKTFCATCPARLACLTGALERREPWGVWGGEIFERGSIVAHKRPRGRPRKDSKDHRIEVAA